MKNLATNPTTNARVYVDDAGHVRIQHEDGTSSSDGAVIVVPLATDLRSRAGSSRDIGFASGLTTEDDGQGGLFTWDTASAADDGVDRFNPGAGTAAGWKRAKGNNVSVPGAIQYGTNAIVLTAENAAALATTDATVTTLITWAKPLAACRGKVVAIATGSAADGSTVVYTRSLAFKVVAGTMSQVGSTDPVEDLEDAAPTDLTACDLTMDVNANTVRVRVTGKAATNMTWNGSISVQYST